MRTESNAFWPIAASFLAAAATSALVFAGMTGAEGGNAIAGVGSIAFRSGSIAALWWMAATGFGLVIVRWALPPSVGSISRIASGGTAAATQRLESSTSIDQLALAMGLGSAALLAFDSLAGSLGLLVAGRGLVAWGIVIGGLAAGVFVLRDAPITLGEVRSTEDETPGARKAALLGWAAIGVTAGLLAVAASVAPGWLWSSEFKGFDALSYHLELPKEWILTDGRVAPIDGNVYSALPSFVECAFMHLMLLRAEVLDGAYACQWWSLFATMATALTVARIAAHAAGRSTVLMAAIVFVAVPWCTVVGSLAYNDMYPCLALAGGWLFLLHSVGGNGVLEGTERSTRLDWRAAIALALLASAAFGAKPSAFLFTALPLLALTVGIAGPRSLRLAPIVVGCSALVLAPWLVRNGLHYGNPMFPFLSGVFGTGPWSAEQMLVFQTAHGASGGIVDRLGSLAEQWILYGFGDSPAATEPWYPLWSLVPIAGILGLGIQSFVGAKPQRRAAWMALAVIAVMCVGWMTATHMKSRFLLPTAVPLAVGGAMLLSMGAARLGAMLVTALASVCLVLPAMAFQREPVQLTPDGQQEGRAPAFLVDGVDFRSGRHLAELLPTLAPDAQQQALAQADSTYWINMMVPPDARILGIGYATPFYTTRPIAWSTVWDRGAFDRVVEAAPGTPAVWTERLRAAGFTHVVVDPTMLAVWDRSGWLNPALRNPTGEQSWLRRFIDACPAKVQAADRKLILGLVPNPAPAPPRASAPQVPQSPASSGSPALPGG